MLMVQSKPQAQAPAKNGKLKPPPPVPPRPNQNVVAEALAKTRKAVAESKVIKSRPISKDDKKSKTIERAGATGQSSPNVSPKLNGLARVKSFIRDVISDRSSSDDKKYAGSNSRRSSTESSSIPAPISSKDTPDQKASGRTMKNCRQALVRSLSTSTKLEPETKARVLKSCNSFAEKTLPLRKAPPPPVSPKPKLREIKPVTISKRNSLEIVHKPKVNPPTKRPPQTPPRSPPADIPTQPELPASEAPYATVDEVSDFDNRLSSSPEIGEASPTEPNGIAEPSESKVSSPKHTNSLERKTSRVTERLISEIIASKIKPSDSNAVIDKGKANLDVHLTNGGVDSPEGETMIKDMSNHEMLIYELQTMRSLSHIPRSGSEEMADNSTELDDNGKESSGRSSRAASVDLSEASDVSEPTDPSAGDVDDPLQSRLRKQFRAISSMSLQGLPPLPKSLSGFAEGPTARGAGAEIPTPPPRAAHPTDLDSQLELLKREMAGLRRLDLSLLSELWSLNEAMASWRQQLERGPRLRPAPPPPPPPHYLRT